MQLTVKDFAKANNVTPLAAQGLITYLVTKGHVKKIGNKKNDAGKGKPASVYEFPDDVKLVFKME